MIDPIEPIVALPAESRETLLRLAIEQFYFGYRAFTALPDRILSQRGLGRVHHRILYFVGRNPKISVNDLLGMLSVTKQALNAPLRQLILCRATPTASIDCSQPHQKTKRTQFRQAPAPPNGLIWLFIPCVFDGC